MRERVFGLIDASGQNLEIAYPSLDMGFLYGMWSNNPELRALKLSVIYTLMQYGRAD